MSQALRAWWRDRMKRPLLRDRQQFAALASVGLVVVIGVLVALHPASASLWTQVRDALLILFGTILKLIIDFLGNLVVILIDVLIGIAQYNNFVHAQPVNIGWPLVRDVVNMFFIVMLLVSAFATIIGYKEFHYTKVLPKLLLMAVLINFSKTLIGLLIDFSQVLMLTFVNAFKQAAGGNFVTALHLDQVLGLRTTDVGGTASETLPKLIASLLLGVLLMGIMLSLILIMIAFIAARVITLWILLIMSPMAFFALALPGKLQKGFSAFTSDFWGKLSTMLIAGPVMAFFLWLALAVAQGGTQDFKIGDQTEADTAQSNFVSAVGNPVDIMTFIVAVALMLQGVEFGLKSAQNLSPALGGLLTQYASPKALAKFTAVRTAARGAYRYGAKPLAKSVDFATGGRASKLVGKAGLAVSRNIGGIGAETFAGLATRQARKTREHEARISKLTADLDPETARAFKLARASNLNPNRAEMNGARISLAKGDIARPMMRSIANQKQAELKKRYPQLSDDEISTMADGHAQLEVMKEMKVARDAAKEINDHSTMEWVDATVKSRGLAPDWQSLGSEIESGRQQEAKKYLATKSVSSYKDSASALAILAGAGAIKEDGSVDEKSEAYELIMEKGGARKAYVEQHLKAMTDEQRRAQLDAMHENVTDTQRSAADAARMFAGTDKSGKSFSINLATGTVIGGPGYVSKGTQGVAAGRTRNTEVIAKGVERLKELNRQSKNVNPNDATAIDQFNKQVIDVKTRMAAAGATHAEAFKFDPVNGVFDNEANRQAYQAVVGGFVSGAAAGSKEAIAALANLDTESMGANPKVYNEARSAAIERMKLDELKKAFDEAMKTGNEEAKKKIQELVQMISEEAKRVEAVQKSANVSGAELQALAVAPNAVGTQEIWARLQQAGVASKAQAAEYAKAIQMHQQIEGDAQARSIRGTVTDRAAAVARATGRGARAAGSAVAGAAVSGAGAVAGGARAVAGGVRAARQRINETPEQARERFERESLARAERQERNAARRGGGNTPPPDETI